MDPGLRHRYYGVNGTRLHVAQAGLADGPLVILLHGFPEPWSGWHRQIPYLTAAGMCVWVPDQRGYNLSAKPPGAANYRLDLLASDIEALIAASGRDKAAIVGHDWGGIVAWRLAAARPERVQRLVVMNAPHLPAVGRILTRAPKQWPRSAYVLLYQLPWLPEMLLTRRDHRALVAALQRSRVRGAFDTDELATYRNSWSQPGAMTAMLNWYRALLRHPPPSLADATVTVPTLLLWGRRDRFLGCELAEASMALCPHGRLRYLDEAGHWLHHEQPQQVNWLLTDFLTAIAQPPPNPSHPEQTHAGP